MNPNTARAAAILLCTAAANLLTKHGTESDTAAATQLRDLCGTDLVPGGDPSDWVTAALRQISTELADENLWTASQALDGMLNRHRAAGLNAIEK